jgi:hypothetical protein
LIEGQKQGAAESLGENNKRHGYGALFCLESVLDRDDWLVEVSYGSESRYLDREL